jgi:hypothetical protein
MTPIMSSETPQVQPDTSVSESYPYLYQPQPPSYYPLRHDQERLSGSSGSSFITKRQSVLKCRGPRDGKSRRNLYRWAKWYVEIMLGEEMAIVVYGSAGVDERFLCFHIQRCSDGSAALAQAEDRSIHVLEVYVYYYSNCHGTMSS